MLRERRQEKLRRRQDRKVQKDTGSKSDDLSGIVPGPQPLPWADQGLPVELEEHLEELEEEEAEKTESQ